MEKWSQKPQRKPQKSAGIKQKTCQLPLNLSGTFDIFHFFLLKKIDNFKRKQQPETTAATQKSTLANTIIIDQYLLSMFHHIPSVKAHIVHLIVAAVQSDVQKINLSSLI